MIQKEITAQLQKSCHEFTEILMKANPKVSYQDATNVWLFDKLAELQIRIDKLEDKSSFRWAKSKPMKFKKQ